MSWLTIPELILGNCLNVFGEAVVYTPSGLSSVSITGIFDNLYEVIDPNTGAIITATQPILGLRNSDLAQLPRQDDTLNVRGQDYRVKEVQVDGQGGSKLFLHEI